jgi:hypothetical protein
VNTDSFLINSYNILGNNKGNKNLPTVFFKSDKSPVPQTKPPVEKSNNLPPAPHDHGPLTLDLWVNFHTISRTQIRRKIDTAVALCNSLFTKLAVLPSIKLFTKHENSIYVTFRYEIEDFREVKLENQNTFLDTINQQIVSNIKMKGDSPLELDMIVTNSNYYIRFQPYFSTTLEHLNNEVLNKFIVNLKREIELISCTLVNIPMFTSYITNVPGYQVINAKNFVGIGNIRYMPPFLLTGGTEISEVMHKEIDKLNVEIESILKKKELKTIISNIGKDENGHSCILLSLNTDIMTEEQIKELAENLNQIANEVSNSNLFHDSLGKIIEEGIKKAQDLLKRENERIGQNTGIIRKIPFIGSVYNWWSPYKEEIKGGSFNISLSNVIESEKAKLKRSNSFQENQKQQNEGQSNESKQNELIKRSNSFKENPN